MKAPNFANTPALSGVDSLKSFVVGQIDSGDGALADAVELVFHDYDYDEHFKVKVELLSMSRSKDDPWSVKYDISLKAYEVDKGSTGNVSFRVPTVKKIPAADKIRNTLILARTTHLATAPTTITATTPTDQIQVPITIQPSKQTLQGETIPA